MASHCESVTFLNMSTPVDFFTEIAAQLTARPNFEFAMGASAQAQVRFSTQTSAARYSCAEVSLKLCAYTKVSTSPLPLTVVLRL